MTLARLIIADDHRLVADSFAQTLSACAEVVGVVNSAAELLALLAVVAAEWLLLDHQWGGRTGLDLLPGIRSLARTMKVVALTMYDSPLLAAQYRRAGAAGFFYKGDPTAELLRLVREGPRSDFYLSATPRRGAGRAIRSDASRFDRLGVSAREILLLVGQGLTSKEIAARIGRGVDDVAYHRDRIRTLLGISTQAELMRCAVELELHLARSGGTPSDEPPQAV